jgi:hypothetical protein
LPNLSISFYKLLYLKQAIKIAQNYCASVLVVFVFGFLGKPVAEEWMGGALNFLAFYNSQSFSGYYFYYTLQSQGNNLPYVYKSCS